ncbi:PEP-CTERM sorting domain-containing protein [Massilia sp. S19_KUP03_FR1]|uniref:PEP-CTERM sorting domain-containing protein n=1 Tax=Massilia sp. S19_KUP03_FR1 TaxID=3025503 RepID=UPI002FCD7C54
MNMLKKLGFTIFFITASMNVNASVVRIDAKAFTPQAGLITFSEMALGTMNPIYNPVDYGGGATAPSVSFGSYFTGQSISAGACSPGAAPTGCVTGTPTGPLSLALAAGGAFISQDSANPSSPVLSGTPTFNGPIAILFSVGLTAVGLDGGYFDGIAGTVITAFGFDGSVLGTMSNQGLGIEFLGLATQDGSATIAGLLFSLAGNEPSGFAIDNLRFGTAGQVVVPPSIPEPSSIALAIAAMLALTLARRRRS